MERVLVGMSGGVDSSVAAGILKDKGYDVAGLSILMHDNHSSCSGTADIEDAKIVCDILGIEHFISDLTREFEEKVIKKFSDEYLAGRTPNPCVDCNSNIKFRALIDFAKDHGFDYIATGHYANILQEDGKFYLQKGEDRQKDQSYFLYNLTENDLKMIIFPISEMDKDQVRTLAKKYQLPVFDKPDSQDICFVDGDYSDYLRENLGIKSTPGDFVDLECNVLGEHKGHMKYTIGQRRGLGIAIGVPAYVVDIDPLKNQVVIGTDKDLLTKEMIIRNTNIISGDPIPTGTQVGVKTRYSQRETTGTVENLGEDRYKVVFDHPVRAVTPGQAGVLYDQDIVIGGGTIE